MTVRSRFDKAYYDRFYGGASERKAYYREEQLLGNYLAACLKYMEQPVRNVVDIGCGLGQWQDIIQAHFPGARYTGVERSEYLCDQYGWTCGSVIDFKSRSSFDLVICKDTLQYLSAPEFEAAVDNLARLCRGALYVSILTKKDWEAVCDPQRTDPDVYLRTGRWYRSRLATRFTSLGGGVYLSDRSPAIPWELETLAGSGT